MKELKLKTQSLNFEVEALPTDNDTAIVVDIPVSMINEVKQDFVIHSDMVSIIAESIKREGQLDPCIVTPSKDGVTYDLLSGRHRKRAVIEAGLATLKCIVKNNLTEDEKDLIVLNTNLNRNNDYLPSELAFAYKRKFDILKKSDGPAMEIIAEENKISRKKVQRYISLTKLIKPLLNRVDSGTIPFIAGVELSKLSIEAQGKVLEYIINHTDCKITTNNVADVRTHYDNLELVFCSNANDNNSEVDKLSTSPDMEYEDYPSDTEEPTPTEKRFSSDELLEVDKLSTSPDMDKGKEEETYYFTIPLTTNELRSMGLQGTEIKPSDVINSIKNLIDKFKGGKI